MNKQRESVYTLRREILEGKVHLSEEEVADTRGYVLATAEEILDDKIDLFAGKDIDEDEWDLDALKRDLTQLFALDRDATTKRSASTNKSSDELRDMLWERVEAKYAEKEKIVPRRADAPRRARPDAADRRRAVEGSPLLARSPQGRHRPARLRPARSAGRVQEGKLRALPGHAPAHRGRDRPLPLVAPAGRRGRRRRAAAGAGSRAAAGAEAAAPLTYNDPSAQRAPGSSARARRGRRPAGFAGRDRGGAAPARVGGDDAPIKTVRRDEPKIGRNDPCWCGSGKKFKKCHGA